MDESRCAENFFQLLRRAAELNLFLRIDMEDSPWVAQTLDLHRLIYERGFRNMGVVIQSYLFRSREDMRALTANQIPIRLVKGAYDEPPEIAFSKKRDVDRNFDLLMEQLVDSARPAAARRGPDGRLPPIVAIATHDENRIELAKSYARKVGLPKDQLEFQLLYGVRRELQTQLLNEGYPVRIYVPFGTEWYPYFMRRLAERPANLWFFIANLFRS